MSSIRNELAKSATRLLRDLGFDVTVARAGSQSYDVATATNSSTPETYSARVALAQYAESDVDGVNILRGDRKVYISPATATVPEEGDVVQAGAVGKIRIQKVWSVFVNADGTAQVFVCQGRG